MLMWFSLFQSQLTDNAKVPILPDSFYDAKFDKVSKGKIVDNLYFVIVLASNVGIPREVGRLR